MDDREQGQTHGHPILPILCGLPNNEQLKLKNRGGLWWTRGFNPRISGKSKPCSHVLLVCWFQWETSWSGSLSLIPTSRLLFETLQKRPLNLNWFIAKVIFLAHEQSDQSSATCLRIKTRVICEHPNTLTTFVPSGTSKWANMQLLSTTTSNITSKKTWSKKSRLAFCSCSVVFFLGLFTVSWIQEHRIDTNDTRAHTQTHSWVHKGLVSQTPPKFETPRALRCSKYTYYSHVFLVVFHSHSFCLICGVLRITSNRISIASAPSFEQCRKDSMIITILESYWNLFCQPTQSLWWHGFLFAILPHVLCSGV